MSRDELDAWRAAGERYYRAGGSGDAGPLSCVHGLLTASWDWHIVWPALDGTFARVLAPNMIGLGFSAKPVAHPSPSLRRPLRSERARGTWTPFARSATMPTVSNGERQRFEVILESIEGKIGVIADGHLALNEKLDRLEGKVDRIDERFGRVEIDVSILKTDVSIHSVPAGLLALAGQVHLLLGHFTRFQLCFMRTTRPPTQLLHAGSRASRRRSGLGGTRARGPRDRRRGSRRPHEILLCGRTRAHGHARRSTDEAWSFSREKTF